MTEEIFLDNEEQKKLVKDLLNVFTKDTHPVKAAFALANAYKIICDNCGYEMPHMNDIVQEIDSLDLH